MKQSRDMPQSVLQPRSLVIKCNLNVVVVVVVLVVVVVVVVIQEEAA